MGALAVAGLVLLGWSGTGHAFSGDPVTLTGAVGCDTTTGHQVVSWTLHNPTGTSVTIDSAVVDASGLSTGSTVATTATLTPNPVPNGGSASGQTQATGDATGDYHLVVTYTFADQDPTVDGEVVLPGGCAQIVVPTTVPVPTTTTTAAAKPAAAAAVAAAPHFTG
jgi:hypothetical protein